AGARDLFIASYTSSGTPRWTQGFGDVTEDEAKAIAIGPAGEIVVTGKFSGTIDLGDGPLKSGGGTDMFLLRRAP
ncbi:MAG: hypothetical protein KAI47_21610, partial [Deltaproteobacteria bacterium]|nr:hypothetical protein [Deltaproteobacteria bacterium]